MYEMVISSSRSIGLSVRMMTSEPFIKIYAFGSHEWLMRPSVGSRTRIKISELVSTSCVIKMHCLLIPSGSRVAVINVKEFVSSYTW